MNAPDHALRAHALLSASSSDRWLNCPPSARLGEHVKDEGSAFAAEGTTAHELAERCLFAGKNASEMGGPYSSEMRDYVQVYLDYVRSIKGELLIEQRLSFEKWVDAGFGTCDAIVIRDGHMSVIDLKYGKGIRVDATDNSQLKLYALAAFDAFDAIYGPIEKVCLTIAQPRLDHIDEWEISTKDLLHWADNVVRPTAKLAYAGGGEHKVGDHCQFCPVRHTCRARYDSNLNLAKSEFGETPKGAELSDDELAEIYPRLDAFVRWANDLQAYCLTKAEAGVKLPGLKLVEGRSVRRISDEEGAIGVLRNEGYDDYEIMNIKPKGITDLEKLLGKTKFASLLGDFISRAAGKPTLVGESDPRPELSGVSTAQADFQ